MYVIYVSIVTNLSNNLGLMPPTGEHNAAHLSLGMCSKCYVEYVKICGGIQPGASDPPAFAKQQLKLKKESECTALQLRKKKNKRKRPASPSPPPSPSKALPREQYFADVLDHGWGGRGARRGRQRRQDAAWGEGAGWLFDELGMALVVYDEDNVQRSNMVVVKRGTSSNKDVVGGDNDDDDDDDDNDDVSDDEGSILSELSDEDKYFNSKEEAEAKEALWVELNKEYLEEQKLKQAKAARKAAQEAAEKSNQLVPAALQVQGVEGGGGGGEVGEHVGNPGGAVVVGKKRGRKKGSKFKTGETFAVPSATPGEAVEKFLQTKNLQNKFS